MKLPFLFTLLYLSVFSSLLYFSRSTIYGVIIVAAIFLTVAMLNKIKKQHVVLLSCIMLILTIQYMRSVVNYDIGLATGTYLKYILYVLFVYLAIYHANKYSDFKKIANIIHMSAAITVLLSIYLNKYQVINNYERMTGFNYSAVSVSILSGISLLYIIYEYLNKENTGISRIIILSVFFLISFIGLVESGSRQVMVGLILMIIIYLHSVNKLLILPVIITGTIAGIHIFSERLIKFYDIVSLIIVNVSLDEVKDSSLTARISFLETILNELSGVDLLIGSGLNSFPSIYEITSGRENVAAHFDITLIISEFGIIGLVIFAFFLLKRIVWSRDVKERVILIFYVVGLSANNLFYYFPFAIAVMYLYVYNYKCHDF